jgi:hypothetical protein
LARWRDSGSNDVPPELTYDPAYWGTTAESIRAWKNAALEWLYEAPGRRLTIGENGGWLDLLREAVRLVEAT